MKGHLSTLSALLTVLQVAAAQSTATPPGTCTALQYIANNLTATPIVGFTCNRDASCSQVSCSTSDGQGIVMTVLPCHQPPAINLRAVNSSGSVVFNHTFTHSEVVPLNFQGSAVRLQVTLVHITNNGSEAIGVQVDLLDVTPIPVTIIPYTIIPIDTTNCPSTNSTPTTSTSTPSTSSPGNSTLPTDTPSPPSTSTTATSPSTSPPTFPTSPTPGPTCQSLQNIASNYPYCDTNTKCTAVDCYLISDPSKHVLMEVEPCNDPPAIRIIVRDEGTNTTYADRTLSHSEQIPVVSNGQTIFTVNVTVRQAPAHDSITVKVDVLVVQGFPAVPLIPETTIPINRSQCSATPTTTAEPTGATTSSTPSEPTGTTTSNTPSGPTSATTSSTPSEPATATLHMPSDVTPSDATPSTSGTSTPSTTEPGTGAATEPGTGTAAQASTCKALQSISENITTTAGDSLDLKCGAPKSGDGTCKNVICTTADGGQLDITLVPCNDPPGFRMVLKGNGSMLFDHTFSKSETVTLPTENGDIPLGVTVDHLNGGRAIGIAVTIAGLVPIVPYTVVPLDTSGCSGKGGVPLAVVVAVPICIVLVLLVVVLVVAVLLCRRYRRSRPYQFQPMSMNEMNEEDL